MPNAVPKQKRIKPSVIKKKAWAIFSKYIRLSNADKNGMVKCYTCTTVKHWKEMQAGHGIGGRGNAVLFLEKIVKPQCVGCNMFAHGRYAVFTRKLIDELGMKEYDRVVQESNIARKYTAEDYQRIHDKYESLFNQCNENN